MADAVEKKRYTGWILCGIMIIAAAMRIILLCHTTDEQFYHNDGGEYLEISRQLANGNGFSLSNYRWHEVVPPDHVQGKLHTDLARTPLFPLLGAGLFFLPFDIHVSNRVCSILLSLLALYSVFLLAREIGGDKTGLWSALLFAFYPYALYYSVSWSTENLFLITLVFAFLFALKTFRGSIGQAVWSGLFIGLAALTRPTAILLIPVIGILLLFRFVIIHDEEWIHFKNLGWHSEGIKPFLRGIGLFLTAALIVLLPWTIRNRIAGGTWNPTTYYDGYVFWLSNSKIMEVTYRTLDTPSYTAETDRTWAEEHQKYQQILKQKRLYEFTAISRQWKEWGKEEIRNHPDRFLYLLRQRFCHYWRMCPNLIILKPWQIFMLRLYFTVVFALAALGLLLSFRKFFAMVMLVPVLFGLVVSIPFLFVLRYRYPFFAPYICIFAGITLVYMENIIKKHKKAEKVSV